MTCTLFPETRRSEQWWNTACCLLAAAGCFGIRWAFWAGGNHGDVVWAQEIVVAVRDIDRRVLRIHVAEEVGDLRAHNLCLGLRQQTHSCERARFGLLHRPLAMDVVDAEGLEDGAEGEDNTRGNGRYVTLDKDITGWNDCETQWMTRNSFYLEPWANVVCPHWKCAGDALWCSHEKKCACVEVFLCTPSVSFSELRLTGRENATESKQSRWLSDLLVLVDNNCCLVFLKSKTFTFLRLDLTPSLNTFGLTTCDSASCVDAILSNSKTTSVCAPPGCWRPLRRGRWAWAFAFFCEVLAQFVLSHSRYPRSERSSWSFKRFLSLFGINGIPKSCRDCFCISTNAVFASWYPSLVDKDGACLSSSTPRG